MNLGSAVSQASSAAGSAAAKTASQAASSTASAASNATANVVSGTSALKPDAIPNINSNIPQNPDPNPGIVNNITEFPGNHNPITENSGGADIIDFPVNDNSQNADIIDFPGNDNPIMENGSGAEIIDFPENDPGAGLPTSGEQTPNPEGPQPGEKVDFGKEINEQGEVEKTATRKTTEAIGRGLLTYASGGQATGAGVADLKPIDKTLGVVSDTLDKTPGVKQVTEAIDEMGIADGVNHALDTYEKAKSGDIKGAVESAKNLKKDVNKLEKKTKKAMIMGIVSIAVPILFVSVVIVSVCGPVLGGFLDVVEGDGQTAENYGGTGTNGSTTSILGDMSAIDMLNEIPGYDNLSSSRQAVLAASASAVANGTSYNLGGHPTGSGLAGIPSSGLDCAGFVQWSLWTGLGTNPGYLTTQTISDKIGTDFIQISPDELQPGDIGLKRRGGSSGDNYNHTGIYAGNGQWFHAAGENSGVIRSNYSSFTIYLRYEGVS